MKQYVALALVCAALAGIEGRNLLQGPAPGPSPSYAPAPQATLGGIAVYNCPSPGTSGYLFQTAPCAFGAYAGDSVYCDLSTEGVGYVSIRASTSGNCTASSSCGAGQFCNEQTSLNGTCTSAADTLCFAGALPPVPAPGPALVPGAAPSGASSMSAPVPVAAG